MPHETPLITTIVVGLVLAFILGAIANRLRMPPLVGYLLAGVVVGPYSPGFVADQGLAFQLSEIGVILLMFGVGLNFSLKDLISVQAIAIPGALGRIIFGTAMGVGLAYLMGWSLFAGMIFGLSLSVASTVVLLKALQDRHLIDSERGRIAVGWVIVEDIAMVLALVLIPAFALLMGSTAATPDDPFVNFVERILNRDLGIPGVVAITVIKLAAFVGFMLVVGRRLIPMMLHFIAHTGSRELFRLAVLAIALGVAAGSAYLFGVSLALGAFFAGMILSESELSHRAAEETLPLRDAFSVLFFVAVGMLFDPNIFVRSPLPVIGVLFIVLIGKSAVAFLLMVLFRRSMASALTIAASLAQIGEFSFILAALGVGLGLMPPEGQDLILAGAMVSIILNPILFWVAEHYGHRLDARFRSAQAELAPAGGRLEPGVGPAIPGRPAAAPVVEEDVPHPTALTNHTILVGYGRVGTVVGDGLQKERRPFVLIEDAEGRVHAARAQGIEVIVENAATSRALKLANAKEAKTIVIAIPNAFEAGQATEQSRKLNPSARIIVRAHSDEEESHLRHLGADAVIMGEREIGIGMLELLDRGAGLAGEAKAMRFARGMIEDTPPRDPNPGATNASIEAALGKALSLEGAAAAVVTAVRETPEPAAVHDTPPVDEAWLSAPAIDPVVEAAHLHEDELPEDRPADIAPSEIVAQTEMETATPLEDPIEAVPAEELADAEPSAPAPDDPWSPPPSAPTPATTSENPSVAAVLAPEFDDDPWRAADLAAERERQRLERDLETEVTGEPVASATDSDPGVGDPIPPAPEPEVPVPEPSPIEPPQPQEVPPEPQPAEVPEPSRPDELPPEPAPAEIPTTEPEVPWWSPAPAEVPPTPAPEEAPVPEPAPAEPEQPDEAPAVPPGSPPEELPPAAPPEAPPEPGTAAPGDPVVRLPRPGGSGTDS